MGSVLGRIKAVAPSSTSATRQGEPDRPRLLFSGEYSTMSPYVRPEAEAEKAPKGLKRVHSGRSTTIPHRAVPGRLFRTCGGGAPPPTRRRRVFLIDVHEKTPESTASKRKRIRGARALVPIVGGGTRQRGDSLRGNRAISPQKLQADAKGGSVKGSLICCGEVGFWRFNFQLPPAVAGAAATCRKRGSIWLRKKKNTRRGDGGKKPWTRKSWVEKFADRRYPCKILVLRVQWGLRGTGKGKPGFEELFV